MRDTSSVGTQNAIWEGPAALPQTAPLPPTGQRVVPVLRLAWDHNGFLLRIVAAGLAVSILLAFLLPAYYESSTRLMPPDNQAGTNAAMLAALSRGGNGLGTLGADLLGMKSSGALFMGILRSRTVRDRLIERFELKTVYGISRSEEARARLAERTTILEDRKSGILTVTVIDRSPQRAAQLARGYVEELDRLVAQVSTSAARREREFIEIRLAVVKQELDLTAKDFSEFASRNATIDIKEQGRAMLEALAALQGQLIAARGELESLKQIYTDQNVRVRAVRGRVAELERQLARLGGRNPEADAQNVPSESFFPSIGKLPLLGVKYADLYRRTRVQEVVFETLIQQYELAKVQEAKETPTVRVLDAADIPENRAGPSRVGVVAMGTALSLLLGVFWVVGRARFTAMDAADPRKVLATEVLSTLKGHVAHINGNGYSPRYLLHSVRRHWQRHQGRPENRT